MLRFAVCASFALGFAQAAHANFTVKTTSPYPGITHAAYSDASVPLTLHLVTIDVSSQEIHLYATQSGERGQTVSDFADCKKGVAGCVKSDVAVNGDLFAPLGFVPQGLAVGGSATWPDAAMDNAVEGWLAFGRPMDLNALELSQPSDVMQPPAALAVDGAIGGRAWLVSAGQAQMTFDSADPTDPFRSAPRTAVGLDMSGRTLYVAVVDGDQATSVGMTAEELASFLQGAGAYDALELDGGGSSALYVRGEGGLVSSPSDGVERLVANHLGVSQGVSPFRFSLVGQLFDTNFGDLSKLINNATVTVEGVTAGWLNSHTLYQVDNIAPHYVCAHGSAPGFKSTTQCRQITVADVQTQGNTQYLSMVLYPGSDPPPDMAPPPDLATSRDAAAFADLAAPRDAHPGRDGPDITTVSGCSCSVGGKARANAFPAPLVVVFLVAAVVFLRRSRRSHD
jgi:MYXO-CTERM domain-containing protein